MLFSEPKIPQSRRAIRTSCPPRCRFQCSSASRKFLNLRPGLCVRRSLYLFQCSSASRKFLNFFRMIRKRRSISLVSVLFSEPKIPQFNAATSIFNPFVFQCSSASRKFLNLRRRVGIVESCAVSVLFSEPKIPQSLRQCDADRCEIGFSALQRAENSSIWTNTPSSLQRVPFQCSSASRKFLNAVPVLLEAERVKGFSALQRAENSSIGVWHQFSSG